MMRRAMRFGAGVALAAAAFAEESPDADPRGPLIKVEGKGRPNPFLVPADRPQMMISEGGAQTPPLVAPPTQTPIVKEPVKEPPKEPGPETPKTPEPAKPKRMTAQEAKVLLDQYEAAIARVEAKSRQPGDSAQITAMCTALSTEMGDVAWPQVKEITDVLKRLQERVRGVQSHTLARQQFRQKQWKVEFIAHREDEPRRSVASVNGQLVHAGEPLGDGIQVKRIQADGVVLVFDGDEMMLPLRR